VWAAVTTEGTLEIVYPRCTGLDVHRDIVVAAERLATDGPVRTDVRTSDTTTPGLLALSASLAEAGSTHVATEATGVYGKPVWLVLSDRDFIMIVANAAHVKNVPGRKTDVADAFRPSEPRARGLIRPSFGPGVPAPGDARAVAHPDDL
jgi:transposase